jgi:hypothetical protein
MHRALGSRPNRAPDSPVLGGHEGDAVSLNRTATSPQRPTAVLLVVSVILACAGFAVVYAEPVRAEATQQPCLVPPSGLVSLWRGEGNGADAHGTNHGVLEGGVGFVPGRRGSAFDFDGIDDDLLIPASSSLQLETAFTVEFWFSFPFDVVPGSPTHTNGTQLINKGWTDGFGIQNGGGDLELGYEHPRLYSTTASWLANIWYHAALTYAAGSYHLYVNGVLEASVYRPDPLLGDLEDMYFSHALATPFNPARWYRQRLDEIAVYDRALTADEIAGRAGDCLEPYPFTGFFTPVDNPPVLNAMNAGRAVPVKFSIGADEGLNILAAGYPKSEQIACDSTALVDGVEETLTAGASTLTYNPVTAQYTYVWKTDRAWTATCRQLVVKLVDGTVHRANFQFT